MQVHWDSCLLIGPWLPNSTVAFSPDGKQIVYGLGNSVEFWESSTGTILQTLEGHSDRVNPVAFSPDGKQVASGSWDKTVRIWDPLLGAILQILNCDMDRVESLAFSLDGKQLASVGGSRLGGIVRIWNTDTGAELRTFEVPSRHFWISFSPNKKCFVTVGTRNVWLWDVVTWVLIEKYECSSHINAAAFSPHGKYVVVACMNGLRVYDMTLDLQQKYSRHFQTPPIPGGEDQSFYSVAFSPDGGQLVGGSDYGPIWVWDATTGLILQTLRGHSGVVSALAFSPNGKQVVSAALDGTIRFWDLSMKVPPTAHSGPVALDLPHISTTFGTSIEFLQDGKKVVSGFGDRIRLWDTATGELLQEAIASERVVEIALSSNGMQIASRSADRTIQFWDLTSAERLKYRCSAAARLDARCSMFGSGGFFSDDEKVMCCVIEKMVHGEGNFESTVRLWNVDAGDVLQTIDCDYEWILPSFSPDGKQILLGSTVDQEIKLFDAATGLNVLTVQTDQDSIVKLAFSPDNKRIVIGLGRSYPSMAWYKSGTVQLFDINEGALLQTLNGPISIQSLIFLPDSSAELGLYTSDGWVMDGQKRLLCLPPEYRSNEIKVNHRSIALGTVSGRVSIIRFDERSKII